MTMQYGTRGDVRGTAGRPMFRDPRFSYLQDFPGAAFSGPGQYQRGPNPTIPWNLPRGQFAPYSYQTRRRNQREILPWMPAPDYPEITPMENLAGPLSSNMGYRTEPGSGISWYDYNLPVSSPYYEDFFPMDRPQSRTITPPPDPASVPSNLTIGQTGGMTGADIGWGMGGPFRGTDMVRGDPLPWEARDYRHSIQTPYERLWESLPYDDWVSEITGLGSHYGSAETATHADIVRGMGSRRIPLPGQMFPTAGPGKVEGGHWEYSSRMPPTWMPPPDSLARPVPTRMPPTLMPEPVQDWRLARPVSTVPPAGTSVRAGRGGRPPERPQPQPFMPDEEPPPQTQPGQIARRPRRRPTGL